jgi:hypothetical protein
MKSLLGYILPVALWLLLAYHQYKQNIITKEALDWQRNWEQHGELPLDKVQNSRLDIIEQKLGIGDNK